MVFQNYALYPHMSVRDNMGFSLKLHGVDKEEINNRVEEAARILDLEPHLDRKPSQLSGGQRQRVAMGRAIVRNPAAFLMDEPLSNLDAKLRVQTRTEVSRLQQRLGTTTIYVTHDQTEALTLGDRVAVMRSGVLQQVGAPMELYNQPVNLFVAGFIGSPAMNFMPGDGRGRHREAAVRRRTAPQRAARPRREAHGRRLIAGIRPEHFEDVNLTGDARDRGTAFKAKIDVLESLGSELYAHFSVKSEEGSIRTSCASSRRTPAAATSRWRAARAASWRGSTPPARSSRARRRTCGWTRPSSSCSTPRTAAT